MYVYKLFSLRSLLQQTRHITINLELKSGATLLRRQYIFENEIVHS